MPQNFFITGMPKSGKTTLLSRIADELKSHGLRVGGFISPEEKAHGARTGFYVMDIESGAVGLLADVNADGPKVSKYHVDIKSFESIALPALRKAERYDAVIIDEIGRMELKSRKFSDALDRVLDSHTPLIASLHSDFVERYAQAGEVIFLEDANRESTYADLVQRVKGIGKRRPEAKEARPKAAKAKTRAAKAAVKKAGAAPKRAAAAKASPAKAKKPEKQPEKAGARKAGEKKAAKEGGKGIMQQVKDLLGF